MRNTLALALLTVGCTAIPVGEENSALGQPDGDYPNYDERVVLYATNRARVDPGKEGWSSYAKQPPLQWEENLNKSSRAHSVDMRDTPCFQHNSCDGTDIWKRITSYYTTSYQSIGENISAGVPDGLTAVHNWLYEIGAPAGETGHRDNIFSKDFTFMGTGFAAGGNQYTNYWTQDFIGNPVTRPAMTDGIHFPQKAASGKSLTFGVTWYDSAGASPSKISVVVDGVCKDLTLARGSGGIAAYEATLSFADGCHAYYFRAVNGSKTALFPDSGSLQAGYGSATCSSLFATSQAPADCAGAPPPDLSSPPDMAQKPSTPPQSQPDLAQPPSQGPSQDPPQNPDQPGMPMQRADAGCSTTPGAPTTGGLLLLLALSLGCWRGARRSPAPVSRDSRG
jgi:hypothetical protein